MPEISIQKQCAGLTDLVHVESFGEPVGELPKQTDRGFFVFLATKPQVYLVVYRSPNARDKQN